MDTGFAIEILGKKLLEQRKSKAWLADAKCARESEDPELFFPEKSGTALSQSRAAKGICNGREDGEVCPVRDQCLEYALTNNERFGVWGGMSEQERAKERRRRRKIARTRAERRVVVVRRPPSF